MKEHVRLFQGYYRCFSLNNEFKIKVGMVVKIFWITELVACQRNLLSEDQVMDGQDYENICQR